MPLNKLENFIKNTEGRILYVNPSDLDSTDAIENQGNSLTRPFKTIQRALLEAARFSWVKGNDNDIIEKTTILLYPGEHIVDNRPGFGIRTNGTQARAISPSGGDTLASTELTLTSSSNFDLTQEDNILYKFNSIYGGVVVPRGTSLVGLDLRKTKVRPKYVPNPTNTALKSSAIFRITGGCYFWQFTTFDGDENSLVYTDDKDFTSANQATPKFSHHKLTIFEYADGITTPAGYTLTDLEQYYSKLSNAFNPASGRDIDQKYPLVPGGFAPQRPEYEIVGAFGTDPIGISNIISGNGATPGSVVTVTTTTPHGLNAGTPIKIRGVDVADYNISTIVTDIDVTDDKVFTYSLPFVRANLPASPGSSGATVTIETDTVSGSSPYIFNCSLRSVWGMNGMHADGAKATGFRSVVAAQFTGVSLQKDDRAFVKYNKTSRTYNEITTTLVTGADLVRGASSTNEDTVYHLDSDAIYKSDWETIHIKATNDAVMQLVSIFAIGYTRHFDVRTGSDYSLTNSNSNFGQLSLVSTGFKKAAFTKDDKAYITSIITPKAITSSEENVDWQQLDVTKTKSVGNSRRLYIHGFDNEDIKPPVILQGYRLGAKVNESLYLENAAGNIISSPIYMNDDYSSFKKYTVTTISNNVLNIGTNHLADGEKVIIVADDGDLPENIEAHKVYYVTGRTSVTIKLASSLTNSSTNTAITLSDYTGSSLQIISRVSDKSAGDIGHPVQWDGSHWYVYTENNSDIYNEINSNQTGATTKISYIKRIEDSRSLDEKLYKLRVVIPQEFSNSKNPEEGFIIQESSTTGLRSDTDAAKSTLTGADYDWNRNPRFIGTCTSASNTVTVIAEQPHGLNAWDQIIVKNVTSDTNPTGVGNSGYNGTFQVNGLIDDKTFTYSTTDVDGNLHDVGTSDSSTTSRTTDLPRFERNDCQGNFYIYRNEVITPYIKDTQDGVYHLYVLNADNNVGVAFTHVGYSQNVTDLYPQQDKDNPNDNPNASKTYANRSPLGSVVTDDLRNSITRETVDKFLKNFHIVNTISNVSTSGGTATLTFDREHNLSGIVTASINNAGSSGTPGTYQNVKLYNDGTTTWDGALAKVIVNNSGAVSNVEITSGGSGYANGETLDFDTSSPNAPIGLNGADITINTAGLSAVTNHTVQITGIGTTASGYYRITSVPSKTQVAIAVTAADSVAAGQYMLNVGLSLSVTTSLSAGVRTFTSTTPHGLKVGSGFKFVDASDNNKGEFIVKSVTSTTVFTAEDALNSTSSISGRVHRFALSANDKTSDSSGENLGSRAFTLYGNEEAKLQDALNNTANNNKVAFDAHTATTVLRFELGSYIQIDEEIMRIVSSALDGSGSDELKVIRGALGTSVVAHVAGSLIRKIKPRAIEFRRPSIIRASGHTFEYIGYGPGNYSTGIPQVQVKTLSEDEDYLAQAQERDCGTVVYTGMNSKGDFIIGNKKINSSTGQEKTFDIPVPTVTGQDPARLSVVFDEVIVKERLLVEGGNSGTILSEFDGPVNFSKNIKIGGNLTVVGTVKQGGSMEITETTDSFDKDSGCLVLEGGLGIEKSVNIGYGLQVGTAATVGGAFKANNTVTITGQLNANGGIVCDTNKFTVADTSGNTSIAGTLGVTGTTTLTGEVTVNTGIIPDADEGAYLGSSSKPFSDAHIGEIRIADGSNDNEIDTASGGLTLDSATGTTTIDDNLVVSGGLDVNGTGTHTLAGPLEVSGSIKAINSDIIAYASSDERLKENVKPIENPIAKLLNLSGNTYTWKEGCAFSGDDTGVIAQEVEALGLPGVVETRADGFKAVRYERLVPLLIEAVKDLNAKVDTLEAMAHPKPTGKTQKRNEDRLDALEKKVDDLS